MLKQDLSNQFPVGEASGVYDSAQSIAEDMWVVTVVESPFQLFQIAVQMLDAHLVEGSDDGTLEKAPHPFYAISVNVANNPLLGRMAHSPVYGVFVLDPKVRPKFVGVNRLSFIPDCSIDEIMQGSALDIGYAFDPDLPAALDGSGHPCLIALVCVSFASGASSYQSFIHFNNSDQSRAFKGVVAHRLSDAVAEIPSRLVRYSQSSMELIGRYSLAGFAHQIDCRKPFSQRQMGIVHDSARSGAEMVTASQAVPLATALDAGHFHATATDTGNPVRPPQTLQVLSALLIIIETIKQGDDIHDSHS